MSNRILWPVVTITAVVAIIIITTLLHSWWLLSIGLLFLGVFGYIEDIVAINLSKQITIALLIFFVCCSLGQMIITKHKERQTSLEMLTTHKALTDATNEIADLKFTAGALIKYASWARLNGIGKTGLVGQGLSEDSELIRLLSGCITRKNGEDIISTTPESRAKYLEIIKKFPDYPFSYYYLALYFRAIGNPQWRDYAKKAITIFEQTTIIAGHNMTHDGVLKELRDLRNK